jgi:glycosyltransferase involved in cell wall biosynthesis
MVGISSIRLGEDAFAAGPRIYRKSGKAIVFVGTLEELYKAPDILIQAVADLVGGGEDLTLTIVGDGRRRFDLERSGAAQALGDRLRFAGALPPGSAVRQELDRADLFVLPSRQEGLPRAMIEAMARGLPAIGSTVGGIPELLSPSELVPPGDVGALRAVIKDLISDPDRMTRLSSRNWDAARRYASTRLMPLRVGFYVRLKEATSRLTATQK